MWLTDLASALKKSNVSYALVGGYAVSLHGAVRGTLDIDLVISFSKKNFTAAEKTLNGLGLVSRLPVSSDEVFEFREEYVRNRNLVAWSFYHPIETRKVVDIIITHNLDDMNVHTVKVEGHAVTIASIEDLIAMKTVSARPQDIADIHALKRLKEL